MILANHLESTPFSKHSIRHGVVLKKRVDHYVAAYEQQQKELKPASLLSTNSGSTATLFESDQQQIFQIDL